MPTEYFLPCLFRYCHPVHASAVLFHMRIKRLLSEHSFLKPCSLPGWSQYPTVDWDPVTGLCVKMISEVQNLKWHRPSEPVTWSFLWEINSVGSQPEEPLGLWEASVKSSGWTPGHSSGPSAALWLGHAGCSGHPGISPVTGACWVFREMRRCFRYWDLVWFLTDLVTMAESDILKWAAHCCNETKALAQCAAGKDDP